MQDASPYSQLRQVEREIDILFNREDFLEERRDDLEVDIIRLKRQRKEAEEGYRTTRDVGNQDRMSQLGKRIERTDKLLNQKRPKLRKAEDLLEEVRTRLEDLKSEKRFAEMMVNVNRLADSEKEKLLSELEMMEA